MSICREARRADVARVAEETGSRASATDGSIAQKGHHEVDRPRTSGEDTQNHPEQGCSLLRHRQNTYCVQVLGLR